MSQIDERSAIPLTWLFMVMLVVVSSTMTGVFWVSTVNFRLQRIEEKLGIPSFQAKNVVSDAAAAEK